MEDELTVDIAALNVFIQENGEFFKAIMERDGGTITETIKTLLEEQLDHEEALAV
jgi:hypothetical protein